MEKCEQCGNDAKYRFVIEQKGQQHIYDSFECAISAQVPACCRCGCRIMGHGVQAETLAIDGDPDMDVYICAHCVEERRAALAPN